MRWDTRLGILQFGDGLIDSIPRLFVDLSQQRASHAQQLGLGLVLGLVLVLVLALRVRG